MTHRARARAIEEFAIKDDVAGQKLLSLIETEKYNMVRGRDGSEPSRYWKVPLYRFWQIVNGQKEYIDKFEFEGKTYSRNTFYYDEPIARADLKHKIKTELAKHGYRVFFQDAEAHEDFKGNWHEKETYVKVPIRERTE